MWRQVGSSDSMKDPSTLNKDTDIINEWNRDEIGHETEMLTSMKTSLKWTLQAFGIKMNHLKEK